MPLPGITSSIFDISCALDKQERVCVHMGCIEMDCTKIGEHPPRVSLIIHLVSPELAQKMHVADGVPEIVNGSSRSMVATMERVGDDLVVLRTQPVTINRVPAAFGDIRHVEKTTMTYVAEALDHIYREYLPDAQRNSMTNSRIRVAEGRMDDFLWAHVLKNPELHAAIREIEKRSYPDTWVNDQIKPDGTGGPGGVGGP